MRSWRDRRVLLAIAAVAIAPFALSYALYYLFPRDARTNYGELLPTQPFPAIAGAARDGRAFRLDDLRGRWVIVVATTATCDPDCRRMLYATRQARTIQNAEEGRVVRLWAVTDGGEPPASLLVEHPGLVVARVPPDTPARLPRGGHAIYLVDPLGNQVLAWPADPDIRALARDLSRLLKASRIG